MRRGSLARVASAMGFGTFCTYRQSPFCPACHLQRRPFRLQRSAAAVRRIVFPPHYLPTPKGGIYPSYRFVTINSPYRLSQ